VLVSGLVLIGSAAERDGIFAGIGRRLGSIRAGTAIFEVSACALIALVTATLNLDTAVVFLTPVLVAASRPRGLSEQPLLYASILVANASSLFLPGSNLTNLIVVGHEAGSSFLARLWPSAVAASVTTVAVVLLWTRVGRRPAPVLQLPDGPPFRVGPSGLAVVLSLVAVLVLPDAAIPVFVMALAVSAWQIRQRGVSARRLLDVVAVPVLVGLFGLAVGAGTLGHIWSGPNQLLAHANSVGTAALAAALALCINNLPAAALLAGHHPVNTSALLIGLNAGPNLFPTGSLAWFLWWRAARQAGASPSWRRAVLMGLVVVPISMGAALLALRLR
jgi:arsenical pump membrane protein